MKKRIVTIILALILCMSLAAPAFTAADSVFAQDGNGQPPRLVDGAGLLSQAQAGRLLQALDEISGRQRCDVVIVTVASLDGKTVRAYADDFFDYNGYGIGPGADGILLLVSMGERDIAMSTHGFGITAFTDAGQDYLWDTFLPLISGGRYYEGFETFAGQCDIFLTSARAGKPYDRGNMPGDPGFARKFLFMLPFSFLFSALMVFLITGVMKSKLKSTRAQPAANTYVRGGSVNITESRDYFMFSTVARTKKEKSGGGGGGGSSKHTSSSGRVHGGSSRKF